MFRRKNLISSIKKGVFGPRKGMLTLLLAGAMTFSATGCDQVGIQGNRIGADFNGSFPVLPENFPLYPRAVSLASADEFFDKVMLAVTDGMGEMLRQFVLDDVCTSGNDQCYGGYDVGDFITSGVTNYTINDALRDSGTIPNQVPSSCDPTQPNNGVRQFIGCQVKGQISSWTQGALETSAVASFKQTVQRALKGKLNFFNPAPIGTSLNQQIAGFVTSAIVFDKVGVEITLYNNTSTVFGIPLNFTLYMGNYKDVADKTGKILLPEDHEDYNAEYTVKILPGEEKTISVDNISHLVGALNELKSLSIDYDADIDVSDFALNASDVSSWYNSGGDDSNGDGIVDSLAGWSLQVKEFKLVVKGNGGLDLPIEVPDFAKDVVNNL